HQSLGRRLRSLQRAATLSPVAGAAILPEEGEAMQPLASDLARRLGAVEDRITAACRRAGRPRAGVTLVAVTKTVSAEAAAALHGLGVADLGESRPQELWRKAADLPPTVRWHLVGHLQRNKIAQ